MVRVGLLTSAIVAEAARVINTHPHHAHDVSHSKHKHGQVEKTKKHTEKMRAVHRGDDAAANAKTNQLGSVVYAHVVGIEADNEEVWQAVDAQAANTRIIRTREEGKNFQSTAKDDVAFQQKIIV